MPMNKKATLLLLEYMKRTIEQMPNDVKINRFFMYGGGAGIILDSGIRTIHLGALTVYEPRKQLRFSKEWEEKI